MHGSWLETGFVKVIRFQAKHNFQSSCNQETKLKKIFSRLLPASIILLFVVTLSAGDLETKGKAWLGSHSQAAAINVNGRWHEKAWGEVFLKQAEGSPDVTGDGDGWDITGVVSGKQIFLLFSHHGKVNYSAQLTSKDDGSLDWTYSRGFMNDKSKTRPMHLIKE
jgi:hypothetical protein